MSMNNDDKKIKELEASLAEARSTAEALGMWVLACAMRSGGVIELTSHEMRSMYTLVGAAGWPSIACQQDSSTSPLKLLCVVSELNDTVEGACTNLLDSAITVKGGLVSQHKKTQLLLEEFLKTEEGMLKSAEIMAVLHMFITNKHAPAPAAPPPVDVDSVLAQLKKDIIKKTNANN